MTDEHVGECPLGCELNDRSLSEEIRLLGDLVVAASGATRPLTPEELDQVLAPGREPTDGDEGTHGP